MGSIPVYLEQGTKRVVAAALDWPGWCRIGRDEATALQALADYAPRYAPVAATAGLDFSAPEAVSSFTVSERLTGSASTDFGSPGAIPMADNQPVTAGELARLQALLTACWQTFDEAVRAAAGKELAKGPRGGGRDLAQIDAHVLEAEAAYLERATGTRFEPAGDGPAGREQGLRQAVLAGLAAAAHGEVAPVGPRGGKRWPPRYFARRAAWHVLDHAWEIEDRSA